MKYRVYVEQTGYSIITVEADDYESAVDLAVDNFNIEEANYTFPLALSAEKREIREGKEVWVGA